MSHVTRYDVMPIPPIEAHTEWFAAGALTIGVEYRILTEAIGTVDRQVATLRAKVERLEQMIRDAEDRKAHLMSHLEDLEDLQDSVGLRGYAQRDPLVEFRREASSSTTGSGATTRSGSS